MHLDENPEVVPNQLPSMESSMPEAVVSSERKAIREHIADAFIRFHMNSIPTLMQEMGITPQEMGYDTIDEVLNDWLKGLVMQWLERGELRNEVLDFKFAINTIETHLQLSKETIQAAREVIHEHDDGGKYGDDVLVSVRMDLVERPMIERKAPVTNPETIKTYVLSILKSFASRAAAML